MSTGADAFSPCHHAVLISTIRRDQQMNEQLGQLLQMKGSEQEARIQQLLKDEDFQRQAFFNLYLQQVQQAQLRHVVRCYGTSIIILYWESVINEAR